MALGNAQWAAFGGGGNQQPNANQVARTIVQLGVALNASPNTLLACGDLNSIRSLVGGPLGEAMAFRQVPGQPCYGMGINASVDGALSAVSSVGSGNATVSVLAAPHVPIVAKIVTGGALGTMTVAFNVNGAGYGAAVTSSSTGPWTYLVPGSFCRYSFPSGTYVAGDTYSVGITSTTVTKVGSGTPNATCTASPLDYYEFALSVATAGGFGTGAFTVSPDGGNGPTGGGSTISMPTISSSATAIPGTGIVLTVGQHAIVITITTPGALGTAIYSYQVDGGTAVTNQATTPNSGSNYVVTIPGTGTTLTFTPGTYVLSSTYTIATTGGGISLGGGAIANVSYVWAGLQVGDSFSFFSAPPSHSTSDLSAALTALQNVRNVSFAGVHVVTMPSSASGAVSQQATLDSAMSTAFGNQLNWDAWCECPSAAANVSGFGDIVVSGGFAIRDTADTDAVVAAARGSDTNRTGLHVSTYRMVSALPGTGTQGFKPLRPLGWAVAYRYVRTDPSVDLAAVALGPMPIYIPAGSLTIGRDESITPALDNVQINTLRAYPNMPNQAYLSITSGGGGWKKTTLQASWQNANWVRVLDTFITQLQPIAQQLLGASGATNADGTIEEGQRRDWQALLDSAGKRAVGLLPGGPYSARQASAAVVSVSPSSQLGVAPKQLVTNYSIQNLGEVSSEQNNTFFGGLLPAA